MIESPCIDVCTVDAASGLCVGCLRTLDEIAGWASLGDAERRSIMQALPTRRPRLGAAAAFDAKTAQRWATLQCGRCGVAFGCGARDRETPCWCVAYPVLERPGSGGCLCPACLAAATKG